MNRGRGGRGRGNFMKNEKKCDHKKDRNESDDDSDNDSDLDDILKDINFSDDDENTHEKEINNKTNDAKRKFSIDECNVNKEEDIVPSAKKQKENNNVKETESNMNKKINEEKNVSISKNNNRYLDFINLGWMKRMDQYIEELKKENTKIPSYLDTDYDVSLGNFNSLEDAFKVNDDDDPTIRIHLVARYQYYIWLKKNKLLLEDENNQISDENKKQFIKWIQLSS